jgi:hypothetical protein
MRAAAAGKQLDLQFPSTWGGARRNAGRKAGIRPNVPHRARPRHREAEPVLVTLRSRVVPLRSQFVFPTVRLPLSHATRRDPEHFRVVHFSVQRDHVHLIVEAVDRRALSSGMRGVAIRIARYVNDLLSRRGSLWADRCHGRALTSPREVRNAMLYVLANFRKHARSDAPPGLDPYSSAVSFDGWREWEVASGLPPPLAEPRRWRETTSTALNAQEARTWLARLGWRRHGLLGVCERPAARRT